MAVPVNFSSDQMYDVIIVGGGPAGLTAALYLARARYRVLVVEKSHFGGQIAITMEVVNYPGIRQSGGAELAQSMYQQAQDFGAEFLLAEVEGLDMDGDIKTVRTSRGERYCFGVLLAAGAHPRKAGFQGETEYEGRGVAYCATCDGHFFTGKELFVVGGGYAAAEESVYLTKFARHVTILIRKDDFSCAKPVADQARNHEKITVLTHTVVEEVSGKNGLDYIRYKNTETGQVTEYRAAEGDHFGVFVFAGYLPATGLVKDIVQLDEYGYVLTGPDQKTNTEGLYAAGDLCVKPLRQVVTAVGEGALASAGLEKYAAAMRKKTGLHPEQPAARTAPAAQPASQARQDTSSEPLFTPEMMAQLDALFARMSQPLVLKLYLDSRPVSAELERYMTSLTELTDKLSMEIASRQTPSDTAPCVKICRTDGTETGLAFHGVPGGREFTSFVLGLYNAAGPGQTLDKDVEADIRAIHKPVDVKALVSLSCTMCPELVTAVQRVAAANPNVTAEVYDLNHFQKIQERYNVASVPCLVINDTQVAFGSKNIRQVVELLKK